MQVVITIAISFALSIFTWPVITVQELDSLYPPGIIMVFFT